MRGCFEEWKTVLKSNGYCVLVIGDNCSREERDNLPRDIANIAVVEVGGYAVVNEYVDLIPNNRRVRRGITGSKSETILVLRNIERRGKPSTH